jgi:hypothetical protein
MTKITSARHLNGLRGWCSCHESRRWLCFLAGAALGAVVGFLAGGALGCVYALTLATGPAFTFGSDTLAHALAHALPLAILVAPLGLVAGAIASAPFPATVQDEEGHVVSVLSGEEEPVEED